MKRLRWPYVNGLPISVNPHHPLSRLAGTVRTRAGETRTGKPEDNSKETGFSRFASEIAGHFSARQLRLAIKAPGYLGYSPPEGACGVRTAPAAFRYHGVAYCWQHSAPPRNDRSRWTSKKKAAANCRNLKSISRGKEEVKFRGSPYPQLSPLSPSSARRKGQPTNARSPFRKSEENSRDLAVLRTSRNDGSRCTPNKKEQQQAAALQRSRAGFRLTWPGTFQNPARKPTVADRPDHW